MYQIDNEKFGVFIAQIRKEKGMTQKELGECLFVSDKTVSKWECGLSMPNIVLLMLIADNLGVTVTELLRGERMQAEQKLDSSEVEGLVAGSLGLSLAVLFPLICLAVRSIAGPGFWDEIKMIIMAVLVTGMFISVYAVGKKHGKSDRKSLKSL